MDEKNTFLDFELASKDQWKQRVLKELKGKEYENIVWDTGEGFTLDPLYSKEEVQQAVDAFPKERGEFNFQKSWTILQEYAGADLKKLNDNILLGLNSGVQGLVLNAQSSVADYEKVLNGVFVDWIKLTINTNNGQGDLQHFIDFVSSKGIDKKDIRGALNYDPIGNVLINGDWTESQYEVVKNIIDTVNSGKDFWRFKTITINGSIFGNSGGSMVNELAMSLALYHEYLTILLEAGIESKTILESLQTRLAVGSSFFMEIAKIKAFRVLHNQLLKSYDLLATEINVVSESSEFDLSPIDQHNNLLRLTNQAMSASVGGANDILLSTFDGKESEFSHRMSTNIQLLLIEESFLSKSEDVSSGSYLVEKMTEELALNAWKKFKEIEADGGWIKSVEKGSIQKDLLADANKKVEALNEKKRTWLGVNKYQNTTEKEWMSTEINDSMTGSEIQKIHTVKHIFKG